VSLGPWGLPGL